MRRSGRSPLHIIPSNNHEFKKQCAFRGYVLHANFCVLPTTLVTTLLRSSHHVQCVTYFNSTFTTTPMHRPITREDCLRFIERYCPCQFSPLCAGEYDSTQKLGLEPSKVFELRAAKKKVQLHLQFGEPSISGTCGTRRWRGMFFPVLVRFLHSLQAR